MKRSGLQYRFNPLDCDIWMFWHRCMWCGENRWDCLHHIISPSSHGHKHCESNASILNSSPMHNGRCHINNGPLHNIDTEIKLLQKTYDALTIAQKYKLNDMDIEFIKTYKDSHFKEVSIDEMLYMQSGKNRSCNKDQIN